MASSEVVEVLVSAPDLVRVVAGPAVVARETPSPEGRAIGAVPEGAVVQVSRVVFEAQKSNASRADVVLLAHTGPPRRAQVAGRNPQGWLRLSGGGRDAWIPERGEENELAARPVLPALFEVASEAGVEVRSHPTDQGGEARLVLRPGEVFDAISCEGDWLKVYHGREAEPGCWWTREIGWVSAGEDDSRHFRHLRGLVPLVEPKVGALRLACFGSSPGRLYRSSRDPSVWRRLEAARRSSRPLDNASDAARRSLGTGPADEGAGMAGLSGLLGAEAVPLRLKRPGTVLRAGAAEPAEALPTFRARGKKGVGVKVGVECAWYVQAHGASVSFLGVDCATGILYSGSEMPAPTSGEAAEAAAKAWTPEGKLAASFDCPPCTVRCIASDRGSGEVVVFSAEGRAAAFDGGTGVGSWSSALRPTPAEMDGGGVGPPRPGAAADGPRFVAEAGFRGRRDGYVYRKGELGVGYYRKDAILEVVTFAAGAVEDHEDRAVIERVRRERRANADRLRALMEASRGSAACVASSDAGRVWCTSSRDAGDFVVHRFDLGGGEGRGATFKAHRAAVLSLALSEDEATLYSGSYDRRILAWDAGADGGTAEPLLCFEGHTAGVHGLCARSGVLYSCSSDNTVRAWDAVTGSCLRSFFGQHAPGTWPASLDVSADGRYAVTGSRGPFGGTSIKLWSGHGHGGFRLGTCLCTFAQLRDEEPGAVSSVALAEGGKVVYTGASDGTVAAWEVKEAADRKRETGRGFLN